VLATGFDGEARGEVLACPGPEPYWTPDLAAEQWWESPSHFAVLYADPDANALACSASGLREGATDGKGRGKSRSRTEGAASAILCVTFREGGAVNATSTSPVDDASLDAEADASDEYPVYVEDDSATDDGAESDGDEVGPAASNDGHASDEQAFDGQAGDEHASDEQAIDDGGASAGVDEAPADDASADDGEADGAEDPESAPASEWEVDSDAGSVDVVN
jgi:hypothetical protein